MKNSNLEAVIILVVLVAIMILGSRGSTNTTGTRTNSKSSQTSNGLPVATPTSTYKQSVSLSTGNARNAYQSYEEYITIRNNSNDPVDITGWQLKNDKSGRAYSLNGELKYFPSDIAFIPQGATYISPTGTSPLQNVILQSGETAIITTGSISSQSPYKIVSFKENMCSGYLENMPEYSFTPSLSKNCPRPADEPGISSLDNECRDFVKRLASCRTPEFETRDREGDICYNCVNGKPLSSSCVAFIKSHFNYNSCVATYKNDPDFSGKTWRIFLGKGWEMWAKDYENIQVFDTIGRLVISRDY